LNEGALLMSRKDWRKVKILSRVKDELITIGKAAELLGLSSRQTKRLWKRYRDGGEEALIHRARGGRSNNHLDAELKQQVVDRYREVYQGFGPTLAVEKLVEEDSFHRSVAKLYGCGCWRQGCGNVIGAGVRIESVGSPSIILVNCCSWTVLLTHGSARNTTVAA
jgi:transposase